MHMHYTYQICSGSLEQFFWPVLLCIVQSNPLNPNGNSLMCNYLDYLDWTVFKATLLEIKILIYNINN